MPPGLPATHASCVKRFGKIMTTLRREKWRQPLFLHFEHFTVTTFSQLAIESTFPPVNHPGLGFFGLCLCHPDSHPLHEYFCQAARNALARGASEPVGSRYYLGWPAELHADLFYHQNLQKGQLDRGTV